MKKENLIEYVHNFKMLKENRMCSKKLNCFLNENLNFDSDLSSDNKELNELEIINIITEILRNINHDGETKYRGILDSNHLKEHINKNFGINCLMTAIYTQDELWKRGIKSTLLQGNPCEYSYRDSHWFLRIYSSVTKKWFFADPVWNSYVYDEKNNILDIPEIYDSLLENKKLIFSEDRYFKKYHYLLVRYLFSMATFKYQGKSVFEKENQQKIYLHSKKFDMKKYIFNKEKDRFLPFNIKEYLYFSKFEEGAFFKNV